MSELKTDADGGHHTEQTNDNNPCVVEIVQPILELSRIFLLFLTCNTMIEWYADVMYLSVHLSDTSRCFTLTKHRTMQTFSHDSPRL